MGTFRQTVLRRTLILLILFSLCLFGFAHCAFAQENLNQKQKALREAVESLRLSRQEDYIASSAHNLRFDECRTLIAEYIGRNKDNREKDLEILGMDRADALMVIATNYMYRTTALRKFRDILHIDDGNPVQEKTQKKLLDEIRQSENGIGTYVLQALRYNFLEKLHDMIKTNQKGMFWRNGNVTWEIVAENDRSHRVSFTYDGIKHSFAATTTNSEGRSFRKLTIEVEGHDVERRTSFRRKMTDLAMNGSVEGFGSHGGNGKIRDAFKKNISKRERTGWREKYLDALENFVIVTKSLRSQPESR